MRKSKVELLVYFLLRGTVLVILVLELLSRQWFNVFLCFLTLLLFLIPSIVERRWQLELPGPLEIVILCFIFSSAILGEIGEFYLKVPGWDTLLHTVNGFLMAAIGFSLIDLLNRSPRFHISLSPFFVAFVAFCFSMTTGILWEFVEYAIDHLFHLDMQKDFLVSSVSSVSLNPEGVNVPLVLRDIQSTAIFYEEAGVPRELVIPGGYLDIGLKDTMKDLLVNCLGALVFSVIGVVYLRHRGRGRLAVSFIPKLMTPEEYAEKKVEGRPLAALRRKGKEK